MNIVLGIGLLICSFAMGLLGISWRRQQRQLARQQEEMTRQQAEMAQVRADFKALLRCSSGIGDRIRQHQQQLGVILQRQNHLEVSNNFEADYRQAKNLADKGATPEELIEHCGIGKSEADFIHHLKELQAGGISF